MVKGFLAMLGSRGPFWVGAPPAPPPGSAVGAFFCWEDSVLSASGVWVGEKKTYVGFGMGPSPWGFWLGAITSSAFCLLVAGHCRFLIFHLTCGGPWSNIVLLIRGASLESALILGTLRVSGVFWGPPSSFSTLRLAGGPCRVHDRSA